MLLPCSLIYNESSSLLVELIIPVNHSLHFLVAAGEERNQV